MATTHSGSALYFPGLNALRFYAAFSVIIVHIGTNFGELRTRASIGTLLEALVMDAQTAVTLFFVISGFLITSLLLVERDRTSTVSIRKFYVRRILRIWPLYYLIASVGFFVLPLVLGESYALYDVPLRSIILVFALMPNFVGPLGPLGHLWTIGLEEQFYVAMPWLVKTRHLIFACSIVITLKLALEPVAAAFNSDAIMNLFYSARFEAMAIGAVGAWVVHNQHPTLKIIYSPFAQIIVVVIFVYLTLVDVSVTSINTFIMSVSFAALIINVATNPRSPLRVETPLTTYFGVRSYGLYMFHFPILYLTLWGLRSANITDTATYDVLLYGITLGATLTITLLSYRFFEQPILRLKSRFAVVATSDKR